MKQKLVYRLIQLYCQPDYFYLPHFIYTYSLTNSLAQTYVVYKEDAFIKIKPLYESLYILLSF